MVTGNQNDLFVHATGSDSLSVPLAERMRPTTLNEFVGQGHLVGPGRLLRRLVDQERVPSLILWGPPGSGKTTLARILTSTAGATFEVLSATSAGVKDLREVVERARRRRAYEGQRTILFIDEIHRFNKSQQDALLPHVEAGLCTLVGATTENPSFEVNAALLSRARVLQLKELDPENLVTIMRNALNDTERGLGALKVEVEDEVLGALAGASQGDARRALTTLEVACDLLGPDERHLSAELVAQSLGQAAVRHDRAGEDHYNVVSALIKSMRASDADAAIYWLARMLEAGEDPMFVARRIVIFASEDVGNAEPHAMVVANAAAASTHLIGMPEAIYPLSQAVLYLCLCPKSNAGLRSYKAAAAAVREHGALPVPLEIRNAVTGLMKDAGYGKGYRYPHDFDGGVDPRHAGYLPEALRGQRFASYGNAGWEARALEALRRRMQSEK